MWTLELIDELAPEHQRTSCSDQDWDKHGEHPNAYFNELGFPRCIRCALLHRLKFGEYPHGTSVDNMTLQLSQSATAQ